MNTEISENAVVVLLLTAPFIRGRKKSNSKVKLLSPSEFNDLNNKLIRLKMQPSMLLEKEGLDHLLENLDLNWDRERLKKLLDRGFELSVCMEYWNAQNIWILSSLDSQYPGRLKVLSQNAPPIIYCCGPTDLLNGGDLAVVGSRAVSEDIIQFTEQVGVKCANDNLTIVSGGARGVDQESMFACLNNGGKAIGLMADRLSEAILSKKCRQYLDKELLLVSPFDPEVRFNVGNAMSRNKLIYALSNYGLVIESSYEKGGTWAGATELLRSDMGIPLFIRINENSSQGNKALLEKGGIPWPNDFLELDLSHHLSKLSQAESETLMNPEQLGLGL